MILISHLFLFTRTSVQKGDVMEEKVIAGKKNGMAVMLLLIVLYAAAVLLMVMGISMGTEENP